MKTSTITALCCGFFFFLSFNLSAQGNSEITILPAYNPSSVQLKIVSNGVCLSKSSILTSDHSTLEVKAYAPKEYDDQELKVPMVRVDLVRKGMLVDKAFFTGVGDISSLLGQAKKGDVVVFSVEKLLIKTESDEYQTFTSGRISFQYEFEDDNSLVLNR